MFIAELMKCCHLHEFFIILIDVLYFSKLVFILCFLSSSEITQLTLFGTKNCSKLFLFVTFVQTDFQKVMIPKILFFFSFSLCWRNWTKVWCVLMWIVNWLISSSFIIYHKSVSTFMSAQTKWICMLLHGDTIRFAENIVS